MAWFGKRTQSAVDDETVDPARLAEVQGQVDEGLLIITSDLRMRAKNQLIVAAHGADPAYSLPALERRLREQIEALIAEKRQAATHLAGEAKRAAKRRGRATHQTDYREGDVERIRSRRLIEQQLALRLEGLLANPAALAEILDAAREAALDEMFQARLQVTEQRFPDEVYDGWSRQERMQQVGWDLAQALRKGRRGGTR